MDQKKLREYQDRFGYCFPVRQFRVRPEEEINKIIEECLRTGRPIERKPAKKRQ